MVEHKDSFSESNSEGTRSCSEGSMTQTSSTIQPDNANDAPSSRAPENNLTLDGVEVPTATEVEVVPDDGLMVGAGVAGGVFGLLVGGPILATLAGFGTAWATSKRGPTGDVARAMGEVALTARSKAQDLDAKHNFSGSTKQAASQALARVQEYERQHDVLAKAREFASFTWRKITDFNREHRVVQRTVESVGQAIGFVVNAIIVTTTTTGTTDQQDNNNTREQTKTHEYTVVPSAPPREFDNTSCEAKPF